MKKILLFLDKNQFVPFDYNQSPNVVMSALGGNSGNSVFQFALQKLLQVPDQEVTVETELLFQLNTNPQKAEYINDNFDCLCFSPANVLANYAKNILSAYTEAFKKIKIPIYALGLGAQSGSDYSLDFLHNIKDEAKGYIEAILNSGGAIGARGYFTGDVIKKLGFNQDDFDVIGCPSLFTKGTSLKIEPKNVNKNELSVAVNGFRAWNSEHIQKFFREHLNSIFICQDEFWRLIHYPQKLTWKEIQYLCDYDRNFYNMYIKNRVRIYGDFQSWYYDLKDHFNFSFGCRIHGNVVPLLAGIPAYVDTFDSRVKELSEYFYIPSGKVDYDNLDVYRLYSSLDYSDFNKHFFEKYKHFESFFNQCGIRINNSSTFIEERFSNSDYGYKSPTFEQKNIISIYDRIYNKRFIELSEKQKNFEDEINKFKNFLVNATPENKNRNQNNQEKIEICNPKDICSKKLNIVFVSHEFGLYPGHGGIASYLYNICKWLLENTEFKISVIASEYDGNSDLQQYDNFTLHSIHDGDLCGKRNRVLNILQEINPDYVEFTDFLGLGLHCVLDKTNGKNFQHTVFVTNNHTATRECFEWSTLKQIEFAPFDTQNLVSQEKIQLQYSDYCIAPSNFLAKYVQKNYQLKDDVLWFMNPFFSKLKTKAEIRKDLEKYIDLDEYANSFNITLITRFEGRKCQDRLIKAFTSFTKNPKVKSKLWLAGNTSFLPDSGEDYRFQLYKKLKDEERKHIKFFDFLSQKQQEPLIAITDLSIMPSTFENQPMAMIETVLRDVPIIASKYSGCADYLDENMLFDPFVENDLLDKIQNFYNLSKVDRANIAAKQKAILLEVLKPENCILRRFLLKVKPSKSTNLKLESLYHE